MGKGVLCESCGGNTPLPDDLRVPQFACRFCGAQLETARYAKTSSEVDHFVAFMQRAIGGERQEGGAPSALHSLFGAVPRPCRHCGQTVEVSVSTGEVPVHCPSCGQSSMNFDYMSLDERDAADDELTHKARERVQQIQAEGVTCQGCGAPNPAPPLAAGQAPCTHCGRVLLLADYLPEHVVARERFVHEMSKVQQSPLASCAKALVALILVGGLLAGVLGGLVYLVYWLFLS